MPKVMGNARELKGTKISIGLLNPLRPSGVSVVPESSRRREVEFVA
jgi:hypothetical protein